MVVGFAAAISLLLSMPLSAQQAATVAGAADRPSFDELYARGQKANAGIATLTASFTETTTASLLERPLVASGELYVHRTTPARIALHYREPHVRTIVIDGNRMTTSWPSRNLLERSDVSRAQRSVERYFGAGDAGELRKLFEIELRDRSGRPGTHEVSMVPRPKQIGETLTRLELWVEERTGLLHAMRMTFANGDTKLMEFESVVLNAAMDPSVFSLPQ